MYRCGECDVTISCVRGGRLSVAADHVNSALKFTDTESGEALVPVEEDGAYRLDTTPGQRIRIRTEHGDGISVSRNYDRNMDVKHFGSVKLGTEKEL